MKTGVFRYRNHPALETNPIVSEDGSIGFQAKFFEGKLSEYESDLVAAIDDVQEKYPDLDRVLFFLPSDFDCNSRGIGPSLVTGMQKRLEAKAAETGLTIEWFCKSRFEAVFTRDEYHSLGTYYFSETRGIYDLVDALHAKTDRLLQTIKSFSGRACAPCQVDREPQIRTLEQALPDKVCVVFGDGGVGKSGLVKQFAERFAQCIVLRPAEVAEIFDPIRMKVEWDGDIESFLGACDPDVRKLFVLDAAEKLENLDEAEAVLHVLNCFKAAGWNVVLTTRTHYRPLLETMLSAQLSHPFASMELSPLTEEALCKLAKQHGIALPDDVLMRDLLRIPFYFDAYLNACSGDRELDLSAFKRMLWNRVVGGGKHGDVAAQCFLELVERHLTTRSYWIDVRGVDNASVEALLKRGVLSFDDVSQRHFVSHDIYEEWALERSIERLHGDVSPETFFQRLSAAYPMVRAYRFWLIDKLKSHADISALVETALADEKKCWFDETIIAAMLSSQAARFLEIHRCLLLGKPAVLCRIVRCVMLACRTSNDQPVLLKETGYANVLRYRFAKPVGPGWGALIDFLHANKESLRGFDLKDIVALLHDWCQAVPQGEITRKAGTLAFEFGAARDTRGRTGFEIHHPDYEKLIAAITAASQEIKEPLGKFASICLENYSDKLYGLGKDLLHAVLENPWEHIRFIKEFPNLTRRMAQRAWLCLDRHDHFLDSRTDGTFGISSHFAHEYYPASAFTTPTYALLQFDPPKTIDWIVEITNATIGHAAVSGDGFDLVRTSFSFPDGATVHPYISDAIWSCHRGTLGPVVPYLLQSIHMALEKFLLETHKLHPDWAPMLEALMLEAIKKSDSASIAGVATSLVLAYPAEYFNLASVILTSRSAIRADFIRCNIGEAQCKTLYGIPGQRDAMYREERLETLKDEFRNTSLEYSMCYYQLTPHKDHAKRKARMECLLDGYSKLTADEDRFFVARTDMRKSRPFQTVDGAGRPAIGYEPVLSQELIDKQKETQNELRPREIAMSLRLWASAKMKGDPIPECGMRYEKDISQTIADFEFVLGAIRKDGVNDFQAWLAFPAAVLLVSFSDVLPERIAVQCKDIIFSQAAFGLNESSWFSIEDDYSFSIWALPAIARNGKESERIRARLLLLVAMLNEFPISGTQRVCDCAFEAIRMHDGQGNDLGNALLDKYMALHAMFRRYLRQQHAALRNCSNPVGRFFQEKRQDFLTVLFPPDDKHGHVHSGFPRDYRLLNALLFVGITRKAAVSNRNLILASTAIALSYFRHLHRTEGELNEVLFSPLAIQYQRHWAQLMFFMLGEDRRTVLKNVEDMPMVLTDDSLLVWLVVFADRYGATDIFWEIWESLYTPVHALFAANSSIRGRNPHDALPVLGTYLLGSRLWAKGLSKWKHFDNRGLVLFERVSKDFPPSVPLALGFSSFANSIGQHYWRQNLRWISKAVSFNQTQTYRFDYALATLISRLELFMCGLVSEHRTEIRRISDLQDQAFVILDFLISQYSVVGYRLKETLI